MAKDDAPRVYRETPLLLDPCFGIDRRDGDLKHRHRGIKTNLRHWYIPFGLVYDWAIGTFILFEF